MKSVFAFVFIQNSKVRRFAFELKMQDKSTFLLAADSEAEMEEWIGTLNKILHSSFEQAIQEKRNGDLHDGVFLCISFLYIYIFYFFDILFVCFSSSIIFACIYLCLTVLVCMCLPPCLLMFAPAGFFNSPVPHGRIYF